MQIITYADILLNRTEGENNDFKTEPPQLTFSVQCNKKYSFGNIKTQIKIHNKED